MGTGNLCWLWIANVFEQPRQEFMDFDCGVKSCSALGRAFQPQDTEKEFIRENWDVRSHSFSLVRCGTRKCCARAGTKFAGEPFLLRACFARRRVFHARQATKSADSAQGSFFSRTTGAACEKSPARLGCWKFIANWNNMPLTTSAGSYRQISRKLPDAVADTDHMLNKNTGEAVRRETL